MKMTRMKVLEESARDLDCESKTFDPFVDAMWRAYRKTAPQQEMSGKNMKWVWKGEKGIWVPNPQ